MHKVFGTKENVPYADRPGAYLIPIRNGHVGVVQTPKGYFLLGGGLEGNESHVSCIQRECGGGQLSGCGDADALLC